MHKPSKQFKAGQVVFAVPDYRCFHKLSYATSDDRPQGYDYAWIVGPSGEFYQSYTRDGETYVRDADHEREFRGTWPEALRQALADVQLQAEVVEHIVKEETARFSDHAPEGG